MRTRRMRRKVYVGDVAIGGDSFISVQSMTNTDTRNVGATVQQIKALSAAGADIVRVAVLNHHAADVLPEIKRRSTVPLVADIHFDYRLALAAIEAGFDKLRINPGNIGDADRVEQVARAAKAAKVPIRIGINSASLDKRLLEQYGGVTPEAMVASALEHVAILEHINFEDIIIALKAPDVWRTIASYRLLADRCDYPLHVGITHAGLPSSGIVTSSVGLGILLSEGLGDTMRVSLSCDPVEEVYTGWRILESLDIRRRGVRLVSCPACGRCQVDLYSIAQEVERWCASYDGPPLTVAVMGCEVNGPGEAREADIGIAAGQSMGFIFSRGEIIAKVHPEHFVTAFRSAFAEMTGFELHL